MEWNKLLSPKRYGQDVDKQNDEPRNEFHKDYDRIVFSSAFRRLGKKTQVHPLAKHDHVHNRLTHSIEVASVGRSLGIEIGNFLLQEQKENVIPQEIGNIVQAACLAHDIGHPPFGHAGEYAIRAWFDNRIKNLKNNELDVQEIEDLVSFEGNAQGLRIVSKIENDFNNGGLKLTYATLGTLIKYPWYSTEKIKGKFNFLKSESVFIDTLVDELGLRREERILRHPLSYLMEAADDICYNILDLEDALELEILTFHDVIKALKQISGDNDCCKCNESINYKDELSLRQEVVKYRSKAIESLIDRCKKEFINNYHKIKEGNYSKSLIKNINCNGFNYCKDIAVKNIFNHKRTVEIELGAYTTLASILNICIDAVDELAQNENDLSKVSFKSKHIIELMGLDKVPNSPSLYDYYLRVTDVVSGMTDNHAIYISHQLLGHAN